MNYGIGIQGSKNKLAERIISVLPPAAHFYDLFCGGGAITHCGLMSGKWRHIHFSDVSDTVYCVRDFLEGNLPDGGEWVSREDFYARKDSEPWIRILWSFAGNQRDYIYSRKNEPYKRAVHEMIYAETPNERRLKFKEVCRLMAQIGESRPDDLNHTERLQRVEQQVITPPRSKNLDVQHERNYQRLLRGFSTWNGSTPPTEWKSADWNQPNDAGRLRQSVPF